MQTVQASRCHSNHSLSDDAVYAFKDCSWRCVIWMLHDYANQNYDHADPCASCQDFQAPTGRRTGGILCSLWRTLPKIVKTSPKTWCNSAKMIKHVENLYSCCAAEFGAECPSSAASTKKRCHFFVSIISIDDLIRGACIAIAYKRICAMAFYHSCFPLFSCLQESSNSPHHERGHGEAARHDVFWILLQGPYQDNAPILPWRRRQPAGSEKGSAISHVLSHSGPRLYSTLRTQKTFNDTMRNWDTGTMGTGILVPWDTVRLEA